MEPKYEPKLTDSKARIPPSTLQWPANLPFVPEAFQGYSWKRHQPSSRIVQNPRGRQASKQITEQQVQIWGKDLETTGNAYMGHLTWAGEKKLEKASGRQSSLRLTTWAGITRPTGYRFCPRSQQPIFGEQFPGETQSLQTSMARCFGDLIGMIEGPRGSQNEPAPSMPVGLDDITAPEASPNTPVIFCKVNRTLLKCWKSLTLSCSSVERHWAKAGRRGGGWRLQGPFWAHLKWEMLSLPYLMTGLGV